MKASPARKKCRSSDQDRGGEVEDQAGDRDRVRGQPRLDQPVARVAAPLGRRPRLCALALDGRTLLQTRRLSRSASGQAQAAGRRRASAPAASAARQATAAPAAASSQKWLPVATMTKRTTSG